MTVGVVDNDVLLILKVVKEKYKERYKNVEVYVPSVYGEDYLRGFISGWYEFEATCFEVINKLEKDELKLY